jgi:hypothetical protein
MPVDHARLAEQIEERKRIAEWHNGAPLVHNVSVHLTQPGNTMGSTSEVEDLQISLEYQLPDANRGDDCFIVLRTQTGWSMNNVEELQKQVGAMIEMAKQLTNPRAADPVATRTIDLPN